MADRSQSDQDKGEGKGKEAVVKIAADVKTLQQLSSSAKAAQDNRKRIKDEKVLRMFDEAIQKGLEDNTQQSSSKGSNK